MSLLSRLAVSAARAYGALSSNPNAVSASYLSVAGGGGGGGDIGGGGGAGGLLASTFTLSTLTTYAVAVGAGGVGTNGSTASSNGVNSSISGTGLTTITSVGGGAGGSASDGASGGSGGGGSSSVTVTRVGGTGTSGQGNTGGTNFVGTNNTAGSGGGGGAGAVGGNASSGVGGNGGNGSSSSISGSSVTYAGGGGGAMFQVSSGTGGTGGTGGGGNASNTTSFPVSGSAGTTNLGGGGGGGSRGSGVGGNGGSGIVIISYTSATPKFVGGTLTTSGGNQIHTFTSSGTLSPITPITASYLVVAGGGGGGAALGGGGGAGGLLTSSTTLYSGATYIVTVGAGGSGGVGTATSATNGSNSILSGTGITTVTTTGGGKGGNGNTNNGTGPAGNGGSGGGGGGGNSNSFVGGTGTSGQGFAGGNNFTSPSYGAGGGGGSSAVGANATGSASGNGGAGTASSISGSSVTYAGGGGAGGSGSVTAGTATGGGGSGSTSVAGTSGTANTGGGGGGGAETGNANGGAGGSGVVIISYAGSQAFNGGLVTSSGGNTIHTFTSTGALTPLTNNLNNSLRFRRSALGSLSRTPTITSNQKTWTWSGWVKRGLLGATQRVFEAGTNTTGESGIQFYGAANVDAIDIYYYASSYQWELTTTQLFRDPSAWYHIVVAVDTTQATAANRVKLYINGNQVTAFSVATYPSQNANTIFNTANTINYLGTLGNDTSNNFDGYMADINFIDGQALEPYYFGNNDANGVWKPILYKGTYGTNGFYLTFGNTTSTTTLGYDSSPNGNNWTTNNISLTAGTTYDAMTDVPTNTSATVANYPTLNPLSNTSTLTEANLSASNILLAGTTMATPSTGKWYFEYTQTTSIPSGSLWVGVASNTSAIADNQLQGYAYASDGRKVAYNSYTSGYGATWTNGDVIGCALDLDNQTITFYKNNTSQGTAFTSITAQPYVFALSAGGAASTKGGSINCGQRPFSYTPPTGFVALNTFNLPTPTILQGNTMMNAVTYTGNGATQNVTGLAFTPGMLWIKDRSANTNHQVNDQVRGVGRELQPDETSAETNNNIVTAFNSNGFSISSNGNVNANGNSYVAWTWKANGAGSSNTSGTITSSVSVNTTAGFSVVTWTANGVNGATVGHGLGVVPKMIVVKSRSNVQNWPVYHTTLGNTKYLFLQSDAAEATNIGMWNNTSPTSTVFTTGDSGFLWTNGYTYVAYCWAEIAGFSAFGSYTGNGSTDGPFVYLNFRPEFILLKRSSGLGSWVILDASRKTYNVDDLSIYPDLPIAEESGVMGADFLSNGFKLRFTPNEVNGSGSTYIYAAFAENPFKISNAR